MKNKKGSDEMSTFSEEEKLQILADMVEIRTENDNEIEVCQYLQKLLSKHDIDSNILKVNDKRANIVAEIGSGSPVLAISGHMDVVASGDENEWTYPPFELTEKDGKLYGRGTSDMKGGLAALVISLIELKEEDALKDGTMRLLATTGEEKEQEGAKLFAKEGYMDDVDGLIIAEPTKSMIFYAHKGSMDCKVSAKGKTTHSSVPFLGDSAIDTLVDFVNQMKNKYQDIKKEDTKHELDVAPMFNSLLDDPLTEEQENIVSGFSMVGSIINGGSQFNSVPGHAYIEYNVRTVPEYDNEFVKKLFKDVIKEVDEDRLTFEVPSDNSLVKSDKDNALVKCIANIGPDYVDDKMVVSALIGTTDGSNLLKDREDDVDFAIFGPGIPLEAHQVDEYLEKDTYLNYIDLYKDVFVKYLEDKSK